MYCMAPIKKSTPQAGLRTILGVTPTEEVIRKRRIGVLYSESPQHQVTMGRHRSLQKIWLPQKVEEDSNGGKRRRRGREEKT